MILTYRIRYRTGGKEGAIDRLCSSPIIALNYAHRHLQIERGLRPDAYEVTGEAIFFNDDATGRCGGRWVESPYDLPKSPNPVLRKPAVKSVTTPDPVMPFYEECAVKNPNQ